MFESIVVSMFLSDEGYTGPLDNESDCSLRNWYALSWGCIHYEALYAWRWMASHTREVFWTRCWMWITSFGNVPWFTRAEGHSIVAAFLHPFPIKLIERAVIRLVQDGVLKRTVEEIGEFPKVLMYTPTPKFAEKLATARRSVRSIR